MNYKTKALTEGQYYLIIKTIKSGFITDENKKFIQMKKSQPA